MSDFDPSGPPDASRPSARDASDEQIVMVPVPRSQLADVYAVLGKRAHGDADGVRWEPLALGLLRGSVWVAREVVRPATRELTRQDLEGLGETLASVARRSARALFEPSDEDPPADNDDA